MVQLQPPPVRSADGTIVGPGGPLSAAPADCGPAHDHCLRGSYFANTGDYGEIGLKPVFIFEGKFYRWRGTDADQDYAFRSAPATAQNLPTAHNSQAIVFLPRKDSETHTLPRSEQEALIDGVWQEVDIGEIQTAAGTFKTPDGRLTFKFEQARVLLDSVHAK